MESSRQEPFPELIDLAKEREIRRTERISGIKINLGKMDEQELVQLHTVCKARLNDAQTDLMIVEDYLQSRRGEL